MKVLEQIFVIKIIFTVMRHLPFTLFSNTDITDKIAGLLIVRNSTIAEKLSISLIYERLTLAIILHVYA